MAYILPDSPPAIEAVEVPRANFSAGQESYPERSQPMEFNLAYLPDSNENKKHYMDVWLGDEGNDLARDTEDEEAAHRVLNIVGGLPERTRQHKCNSILLPSSLNPNNRWEIRQCRQ